MTYQFDYRKDQSWCLLSQEFFDGEFHLIRKTFCDICDLISYEKWSKVLSHIKSIFDCHTHARYYLSITHLVFCSTSLVRNVAKNQSNYRRRKIRESFSSKSCWHIQFDKEGSFSKTKQDVNAILKISKHWRNMMPLSHSFIIRTEQLIWKFFVNGIMPIIIENELKKG